MQDHKLRTLFVSQLVSHRRWIKYNKNVRVQLAKNNSKIYINSAWMNLIIICFVLWDFPQDIDSLKDLEVIFSNYKYEGRDLPTNQMTPLSHGVKGMLEE